MSLYASTVAPSEDAITLDMTELLEHVRSERCYAPRHRRDPHPAAIALIAVGGLFVCVSFWGLVSLLVLSAIL